MATVGMLQSVGLAFRISKIFSVCPFELNRKTYEVYLVPTTKLQRIRAVLSFCFIIFNIAVSLFKLVLPFVSRNFPVPSALHAMSYGVTLIFFLLVVVPDFIILTFPYYLPMLTNSSISFQNTADSKIHFTKQIT
jgi:hypothetical protein